MKKFVCGICGYVYEGMEAPEKCPQCGAPKEKFTEMVAGVKESSKACSSTSRANAPKSVCTSL